MLSKQRLLRLSRHELGRLFAGGYAGQIPNGAAQGTALMLPGSTFNAALAEFVRLFVWQGKTFDANRGELRNRITPLGLHAVRARVYVAASRFDGKPCIVLDYSKTSFIARFIRDEVRAIAPGLYLGRVYIGKRPAFGFCLEM